MLKARLRNLLISAVLIGSSLTALAKDDEDSWTSEDKYLHGAVSFGIDTLGFWTCRELLDLSTPNSLLIAATGTFAIGLGKELIDSKFSEKDLAWDALGIAASSGLWYFFTRVCDYNDYMAKHDTKVILLPPYAALVCAF